MRSVLLSASVLLCAHACAFAGLGIGGGFSFTPLGDLPGGSVFSSAATISRDGTTVIGSSSSASGPQAFYWRSREGMVGIGEVSPSLGSVAHAVSGDGSVIVGIADGSAFRWEQRTGMVDLGAIPPAEGFSNAWGVSNDGRFVTGTATSLRGFEGFRYDQQTGVMSGIGGFEARNISDDGAVISSIQIIDSKFVASRWTEEIGHETLGFLHPSHAFSDPTGMSADGSVIVGRSSPVVDFIPTNPMAYRWTQTTGMVPLPSTDPEALAWTNEALGVSADGSTVVGFEGVPGDDERFAVLWRDDLGAINLQQFLEREGVDFGGHALLSATGISGDGRTIVGSALDPLGNSVAYMVTIPTPGVMGMIGLAVMSAGARRRGK